MKDTKTYLYGLSHESLHAIKQICASYPQISRAILYGSRAMGTHRASSDIDLTLEGPEIDYSTFCRIDTELDDLLLPWKIDLSILYTISNPDLLAHIKRDGKVIYDRENT
jgi:predicted nucleotidyltransferase